MIPRFFLFRIKSQNGVAYIKVTCKKVFNVILQSSKPGEITFSHKCMLILYFIGTIWPKNDVKRDFEKRYKAEFVGSPVRQRVCRKDSASCIQLHSSKPELRFCTRSNTVCDEVCDGGSH